MRRHKGGRDHEPSLGIDAGGTFTDFVIANKKTGEVKLFKALSTPSDPTKAIENGLKLIADDLGLTASEIVGGRDLCAPQRHHRWAQCPHHPSRRQDGPYCTAGHED